MELIAKWNIVNNLQQSVKHIRNVHRHYVENLFYEEI
jgi:hypothetical protein